MTEGEAAEAAGIPKSHRMKLTSSETKGFLGNDDHYYFNEINDKDAVVAKWEGIVHTQVRGMKVSTSIRKL